MLAFGASRRLSVSGDDGLTMDAPTGIVYILCSLTSGLCTWLLIRGYLRGRVPALMWSAVCFLLLTLNNVAVFLDIVVLPHIDLSLLRLALSLAAVSVLVFGFVWEM